MKKRSEQDFNWWFAKIFERTLLLFWWFMLFAIVFNFANFLSASKEYWNLFALLFWGIGYFATSMVMFHNKALAVKNGHQSEIPYHERGSKIEGIYYPAWFILSIWFLITIFTKSLCWLGLLIYLSIAYFLYLFCFINSIEDPKEEKESRKV